MLFRLTEVLLTPQPLCELRNRCPKLPPTKEISIPSVHPEQKRMDYASVISAISHDSEVPYTKMNQAAKELALSSLTQKPTPAKRRSMRTNNEERRLMRSHTPMERRDYTSDIESIEDKS